MMNHFKYIQPTADVIRMECRDQFLGTSGIFGVLSLGSFFDNDSSAWGGGSGSAGGSSMGGWTDNGNSAW